jgi:hypothetical protein
MSSDLDLNRLTFKAPIRSAEVDANFQDIQNNYNALRAEYQATASSLQDNIHLRKIFTGFHNTGGDITTNNTNLVSISAGSGIVNGEGVEWTAASSATFSAATTARKDIIQVNNSGVLSIAAGSDGNTATLPVLGNTVRPLYLVDIDTASPQVIGSAQVTDIRRQGCYVNGKYFFKIQDAIDYITEGEIKIMAGSYFEELDLSGKSDISLIGQNGTKLYRVGGSSYGIQSLNSVGNETNRMVIENIDFYGNSKGGDFQNLRLTYCDDFTVKNCRFDGNASSSSAMKDFLFSNCDGFNMINNMFSNWYASTSQYNTCTKYMEDGFMKAHFMFCASTSEFNNMLSKGFTLLTGMGTRFPRANQSTAEGTGGSNAAHTHTGSGTTSVETYTGLFNGPILDPNGDEHTHTYSFTTSSASSSIPEYYDMIPLIHR